MKKTQLRQLIREEYKNISEKFQMAEYEDVLNLLHRAIQELKYTTKPDDRSLERQINTIQKKLEKLTDEFESLLMKMDK